MFGQAIGDALGIPLEFKSAKAIATLDPDRLRYTETPRLGGAWKAGEWSDDTAQALCILSAFVHDGGLGAKTLAAYFHRWLHEDGRGCGGHTILILNHPQFRKDPIGVSHAGWDESGRWAAPNGAVMRVSAVGVLRPWDLNWTERAAVLSAQVTHYDPRCVASSVAVAIAVASLVRGDSIPNAIQEAERRAASYHHEAANYMRMSLEELKLDEGMGEVKRPPIGYTYKCLGAGFWALRNMERDITVGAADPTDAWATNMDAVLAAGGDVDTNAAVAGALMGAYTGVSKLPPDLVHGLIHKEALLMAIKDVINTGLKAEIARKVYLDGDPA